jgi:medium-chain acyl-[acyl-carrier-protein] hydrolase
MTMKSQRDRPDMDSAMVYQRKYKILASDVDINQRLRMSTLMRFLQELSIAHTEELGCTKERTLDRGLLWVVSRVRFQMTRAIRYDEEVTLVTWPGKMQHVLFPRYYRIFDKDGEMVLNGSAIWFLIDQVQRTFLFPKKYDIMIPGICVGGELELPEELPSLLYEKKQMALTKSQSKEMSDHENPAADENSGVQAENGNGAGKKNEEVKSGIQVGEKVREVRYSDLDLNGHVNNTRYLDWIDDLHTPDWHGKHLPKMFQINFKKEIRPGSRVTLKWIDDPTGKKMATKGEVDGKTAFSAEELFL